MRLRAGSGSRAARGGRDPHSARPRKRSFRDVHICRIHISFFAPVHLFVAGESICAGAGLRKRNRAAFSLYVALTYIPGGGLLTGFFRKRV